MVAPQRAKLEALTGLRGLAALQVVFYHFAPQYISPLPSWARGLVGVGDSAVDLFFVLSGFVLAYSYLGRPFCGVRAFWRARLARVYPAYALAGLLMFPLVMRALVLGIDPSVVGDLKSAALYFSLLQSWDPATAQVWNTPGWSLSDEVFFYALFPLAALVPVGACRRGALQAAAVLLCVLMAGVIVFASHSGWRYVPLLCLPEFALGVCLGLLFLQGHRVRLVPGFAAGLLLATELAAGQGTLLARAALPLGFAALIYRLAQASSSPLARVLAARPLLGLGEASYAIYVLQVPLWGFVMWLAGETGIQPLHVADSSPLFLAWYVAVLVSASVLVAHYMERPARRWLLAQAGLPNPYRLRYSSLREHFLFARAAATPTDGCTGRPLPEL